MSATAASETHAPTTPGPIATILGFAGEQRGRIWGSIALAAISVVSGLIPYIAVAVILTRVFQGTADLPFLLSAAALTVAASLVRVGCYAASTVVSHRAAYEILASIRIRLARALVRAPLGATATVPSGELTGVIVDDVEKLEYPLAHAIPELVSNLLAPVIIGAMLFTIDWRIGLAALATLPIGMLIYAGMMAGRGHMYEEYTRAVSGLSARAVEYVAGIQVVKMFGRSDDALGDYGSVVRSTRDLALNWYHHCWPFLSAFSVITPASLTLVLPLSAWLFSVQIITLHGLILSVLLSLGIVAPLMKLVEFSENFAAIGDTGKKVSQVLSIAELPEPAAEAALSGGELVFTDVGFGYGSEQLALSGVSFTATPGTTTALAGPSGAGKSTIARLLMRFWDVDSGAITLGGIDLRDMPLAQLMRQLAYVEQESFLFDTSLLENIRLGNPAADEAALVAAGTLAGCAEIADRLPGGWHGPVGDGGRRLSGGERQRVAIARALAKDAPILLLDEATAATDPTSEHRIQQSLSSLAAGRTVIVIAHRLATIRSAEQILFVDRGRILAAGTHEELITTCAPYRELWELDSRSAADGVSPADALTAATSGSHA